MVIYAFNAFTPAARQPLLLMSAFSTIVILMSLFCFAALLNNKAATLNELKRYDYAEENWKNAIEILKKVGYHDGEIAVSLVMLAHLTFDRDDTAYEQVEALLDEA